MLLQRIYLWSDASPRPSPSRRGRCLCEWELRHFSFKILITNLYEDFRINGRIFFVYVTQADCLYPLLFACFEYRIPYFNSAVSVVLKVYFNTATSGVARGAYQHIVYSRKSSFHESVVLKVHDVHVSKWLQYFGGVGTLHCE